MQKPKGRPRREVRKRAITCYLPEDQHERLQVSAHIARKPLTAVVEQVLVEWLERNSRAIDAASKVLRPDKLEP